MPTVYVSIGNSDDNLSQLEWSLFYSAVDEAIRKILLKYEGAAIHGTWVSLPHEPWQNACWCISADDELADKVEILRARLRAITREFRQDSIAWAEAPKTEFLCAG